MQITRKSIASGIIRTREINVTQEELDRIAAGEMVHKVLPHVPNSDREFLISGMTEEEWEDSLPDPDEF
jgi:hypothetical protein